MKQAKVVLQVIVALAIFLGSSGLASAQEPECSSCHPSEIFTYQGHLDTHQPQPTLVNTFCIGCHANNLSAEHAQRQLNCEACHAVNARYPVRNIIDRYKLTGVKGGCPDCHAGVPADLSSYPTHTSRHYPSPSLIGTLCEDCHANNLAEEHTRRIDPATGKPYDCLTCHGPNARAEAKNAISWYELTGATAGCPDCHAGVAPDLTTNQNHIGLHVPEPSLLGLACKNCHLNNLATEHFMHLNPETGMPYDCLTCHSPAARPAVREAISRYELTGQKAGCYDCHVPRTPDELNAIHGASPTTTGTSCGSCHNNNMEKEHTDRGYDCNVCHGRDARQEARNAVFRYKLSNVKAGCPDCHDGIPADLSSYPKHIDIHLPSPTLSGTSCQGCHADNLSAEHGRWINPLTNQLYDCLTCHGAGAPQLAKDAIANYQLTGARAGCPDCHIDVSPALDAAHVAAHDTVFTSGFLDCKSCHVPSRTPRSSQTNLQDLHMSKPTSSYASGMDCQGCHNYAGSKLSRSRIDSAIESGNRDCLACHNIDAYGHDELHTIQDFDGQVANSVELCSKCHIAPSIPPTNPPYSLWDVHMGKSTTSYPAGMNCSSCHAPGQGGEIGPLVLEVINRPTSPANRECKSCHATYQAGHVQLHGSSPSLVGSSCISCHADNLVSEHEAHVNPVTGQPYDCLACHGDTASPSVQSAISRYLTTGVKAGCSDCHMGVAPDLSSYAGHVAVHQSGEATTDCLQSGCHTSSNLVSEHGDRGYTCLTCHDYAGTKLDPVLVQNAIGTHNANCSACHEVHGDITTIHTSSANDCTECHSTDIMSVHGQDCSKCHDNPAVTPTAADCTTCHPTKPHSVSCTICHGTRYSSTSYRASDVHMKHTGKVLCGVCHQVPSSTILDRTGVYCAVCHSSAKSYDPSRVYDIHRKHAEPNGVVPDTCNMCHGKTTPAGVTSKSCTVCHPNTSTYSYSYYSGRLTELHRKHEDVECTNCHHDEQLVFDRSTSCRRCHDIKSYSSRLSVHAKHFGGKALCDACHGSTNVYASAGYTCQSCHGYSPSYWSTFDVHKKHAGHQYPCTVCHPLK